MVVQDKLDAVRVLLEEHNAVVQPPGCASNPDPDGYVDIVKFFANLKAIGATTEDRMKGLSWEDILECFPPSNMKPKLLAKDIAKVFRGNAPVDFGGHPLKDMFHSDGSPKSKKADRMSPRELVEALDPENADDAVGKRLATMSKGKPFIVFETGRFVDVDSTHKLLMEVKQGYDGRESLTVNGQVKPVYQLGELPDNFADENPLYPNRPLRPDGTCDQTNRSWEGVPLEMRQLIRVAIMLDGGRVAIEQAHALLDATMVPNAMAEFRLRNHQASIKFDEMQQTGKLPTLKIALGGVEGGAGNSPRPFSEGKKVVWAEAPSHLRSNVSNAGYYKSITPQQWEEQQKRNQMNKWRK